MFAPILSCIMKVIEKAYGSASTWRNVVLYDETWPFINSVPISFGASKVWLICKYHFNSVVVIYPMYRKIRSIYGINGVVSKLAGEFCFPTSRFIVGKIKKLAEVPFVEQRVSLEFSRVIVEERSIAIQ